MTRPRRTQQEQYAQPSSDAINAAMQWGGFQATLTSIQTSVSKMEIAMGQMVTKGEFETRMTEMDRRFKQIETDIEDMRKSQQSSTDRTYTQSQAIIMTLVGALLTAFLYYVVTHLH